jgi:hypothetical protein
MDVPRGSSSMHRVIIIRRRIELGYGGDLKRIMWYGLSAVFVSFGLSLEKGRYEDGTRSSRCL